MQKEKISDLIFSIPQLISYISTYTEIYPGDVIVTGTPSGVGHAKVPPQLLKEGDVIEVEITKIGILKNTIKSD